MTFYNQLIDQLALFYADPTYWVMFIWVMLPFPFIKFRQAQLKRNESTQTYDWSPAAYASWFSCGILIGFIVKFCL